MTPRTCERCSAPLSDAQPGEACLRCGRVVHLACKTPESSQLDPGPKCPECGLARPAADVPLSFPDVRLRRSPRRTFLKCAAVVLVLAGVVGGAVFFGRHADQRKIRDI